MNAKLAVVYVWKGKAYVPTEGQVFPGGGFVDIDPVSVVELANPPLVEAIMASLSLGHPPVASLTPQEWTTRKDPILIATGARSWSELYRHGENYTIEWTPERVLLQLSDPDPQGGWNFGIERQLHFPPDVRLETLVDAILRDIASKSSKSKQNADR
jgi:hypothetical protein